MQDLNFFRDIPILSPDLLSKGREISPNQKEQPSQKQQENIPSLGLMSTLAAPSPFAIPAPDTKALPAVGTFLKDTAPKVTKDTTEEQLVKDPYNQAELKDLKTNILDFISKVFPDMSKQQINIPPDKLQNTISSIDSAISSIQDRKRGLYQSSSPAVGGKALPTSSGGKILPGSEKAIETMGVEINALTALKKALGAYVDKKGALVSQKALDGIITYVNDYLTASAPPQTPQSNPVEVLKALGMGFSPEAKTFRDMEERIDFFDQYMHPAIVEALDRVQPLLRPSNDTLEDIKARDRGQIPPTELRNQAIIRREIERSTGEYMGRFVHYLRAFLPPSDSTFQNITNAIPLWASQYGLDYRNIRKGALEYAGGLPTLQQRTENTPRMDMTWDGYPPVHNPDGSISTELSITITEPEINHGRPTNIPLIWKGSKRTPQEAIRLAKESKIPWKAYPSIADAVRDAEKRHGSLFTNLATGPLTSHTPNLP